MVSTPTWVGTMVVELFAVLFPPHFINQSVQFRLGEHQKADLTAVADMYERGTIAYCNCDNGNAGDWGQWFG